MSDSGRWPVPGRHPGGRTCQSGLVLLPVVVAKVVFLALFRGYRGVR